MKTKEYFLIFLSSFLIVVVCVFTNNFEAVCHCQLLRFVKAQTTDGVKQFNPMIGLITHGMALSAMSVG